jgi:hypothetical protein
MDYRVTRNGQPTGRWFKTAADAWQWIDKQIELEKANGFPRISQYVAYYNPTGTPVNALGAFTLID